MLGVLFNTVLDRFGYRISKTYESIDCKSQLKRLFKNYNLDLVIDVGANEGQFYTEIRELGYTNKVISFEPLHDAHAAMSRKFSNDPNLNLHPRCAIGNYTGKIDINVSGNSVSSSILEMDKSHYNIVPSSRYIGKDQVNIFRLDDIFTQQNPLPPSVMLKIDTQGYENNVLDGAASLINNISVLMLEISFLHLYSNQPKWDDLLRRVSTLGFTIFAIQPGFIDPKTYQLCQADFVFIRKS